MAAAAAAMVVAASAQTVGAPLPVSFSGTYVVTTHVTNVRSTAAHWVFAPLCPCAPASRSIAFRQRLATEKRWRSTDLHYSWSGTGYHLRRVLRNFSDCATPAGKAIPHGFDVTSTQTLRVTRAVDGVVVAFNGDGRDTYAPNAAGKAAGCKPGAYVFSIDGKRR